MILEMFFVINGSQLKNPDISGALYTLRIQYSYTQTQCENGARDVRVLLLTPITWWNTVRQKLHYLEQ